MARLRKCPFCNKKVGTKSPDLYHNKEAGKWMLTHCCTEWPTPIKVYITVYGKTKRECFDNWNGVQHENETSESL